MIPSLLNTRQRFEACIICGAIGDAWGSTFENEVKKDNSSTYYLGPEKQKSREWAITDDTQLTLASCEALCDKNNISPEILSAYFIKYYRQKKLTGIGASTLKALVELEAGSHWSQVGRSGEYAAGNGAAMRIAPFAFFEQISRESIRDFCRITHKNDEAYTGALAVVLSIRAIINNEWNGSNNFIDILIPQLPDTNVRDRLIKIASLGESVTIAQIAALGNNGYVVNSVPLAIFAASQVTRLGLKNMFEAIINAGGDTDTNASIAGQIAGSLVGLETIPGELLEQLKLLNEYEWICEVVDNTKPHLK